MITEEDDLPCLKETSDRLQSDIIVAAMRHCGWNITLAAKALNMNRTTLAERIRRFKVILPDREPGVVRLNGVTVLNK